MKVMDKQLTFEQSLRSQEFEPDGPNYTPRISGIMHIENGRYNFAMSILKSDDGDPSVLQPLYITLTENPTGWTRAVLSILICTTAIHCQALRESRRWLLFLARSMSLPSAVWENLNPDNKVSLFVRYIDIETGIYESQDHQ
ncbi:MAG: IMP cyclohydrolase [Eubacterium sp.]